MSAAPQGSDALARTFIDLLRREAGQDRTEPAMPLDDLDGLLGLPDQREARTPPALRPDLAAAAVMLARAIDAQDGLLLSLRRGAPVVSVAVPSSDWTGSVERVIRVCALGQACSTRNGDTAGSGYSTPEQREAVIFARDGSLTSTHRAERGNEAVGDAVQFGHAVVGIAPDPVRLLPADLVRAAEFHVVVGAMDPRAVALAIEAITGTLPTRHLNERLAAACDPSDLRLSLHARRGAEEALSRLEAVLSAKHRDVEPGPRLEGLHGYGAARAWGIALADDLRRWRAGELDFRACESALLLSGPPGCGKTQFALALARSTELPLLAGSLGQWQSARDGHLGHTLAAMRQFFEHARREPCIALIDEIDSFGDRNTFPENHRDYSSQVVNALLEHLDGAVSREGIVVIGATNHPDRLDPALRRSGRLDRHIHIDLPSTDDLAAIMRHYLGKDLPEVELRPLAMQARGMTGADVEVLVRRARGYARRRTDTALTVGDLAAAVRDGRPSLGEAVRLRAAVHEAGHGLASVIGAKANSVSLSVQETGGLAEVNVDAAVGVGTEDDFEAFLVLALAGRAAEEVMLGDVSAGAAGDLAVATRCAGMMEARWGFSSDLPLVSVGSGDEVDIARMPWLLKPVQARLGAAYERALDLMRTERLALERLAEALFRKGYLEDAEVRALVAGKARPTRRRRPSRSSLSGEPLRHQPGSGSAPGAETRHNVE
ncbi:AAA family ATPase [Methylobacterium soli]|uniref:AAA family ATPase n=1 Tax=Methylobacterium soli TaxID=553447 RepID=A0A6L3ST63_9HYPH|nr:AAA family ATPase [Methylobacterium soli]KAB1076757.1 AAA family ATPase [Methylobacterium soli]GJE43377.1 ATP-dependent zinc metalloprotease FtsH [Methylobacterium soli]